MRILLSWRYCGVGGVETWMVGMARAFQAMGHHCELFFFQPGPFLECVPPDCKARVGDLADMLRLVAGERVDVVQSATIDFEYGVAAVRRLGAKLIVHGNGWVQPAWNSSNCDAIVGCSEWNARAQQAWTDLPVQVVPNGIDLQRFRPPDGAFEGPPIVAWVGRGADLKQKQIHRLAAVAPLLREGGVRLWVADSDGPTKVPPDVARVLSATAEKWEAVTPVDMPGFFRQVAATGGCVLSTSSFEGLSLAYLEAQACGCPLIGPDVIGVNESLDVERGGVLYPTDLPAAELARLVLSTVGDRERMTWRQRASREFVASRYGIDRVAEAYLRIYEASPYRSNGVLDTVRTRVRLSPMNWKAYAKHRWAAGIRQFQASKQLLEAGERALASVALRASLAAAPTIYSRTHRLAHCLDVLRRDLGFAA